jgi:hypothetical protein
MAITFPARERQSRDVYPLTGKSSLTAIVVGREGHRGYQHSDTYPAADTWN